MDVLRVRQGTGAKGRLRAGQGAGRENHPEVQPGQSAGPWWGGTGSVCGSFLGD